MTAPDTAGTPGISAGHTPDTADLVKALTAAAATIGAIYEWLDRVEKAGGATSISGAAACHAMLTSLRKNAGRTEKLVMEPARAAIAKATGSGA
jgi:hypothetical protein